MTQKRKLLSHQCDQGVGSTAAKSLLAIDCQEFCLLRAKIVLIVSLFMTIFISSS